MTLKPESTGLVAQWKVDLSRLEWTLAHVTPACLHCCTASNTDALLNAALSVSDSAGEAALQGVSVHVLAANGHAQDKGELVQAALNVGHSIKILAGNLPCRVVNVKDKTPLAPGEVPALCIAMLTAARAGGGKKTVAKSAAKSVDMAKDSAAKRKRMQVVQVDSGDDSGGDSGSGEEEVKVVKVKTPSKTPFSTPVNAAKKHAKTPAKTLSSKTPAKKTPSSKIPAKKSPGKTPR